MSKNNKTNNKTMKKKTIKNKQTGGGWVGSFFWGTVLGVAIQKYLMRNYTKSYKPQSQSGGKRKNKTLKNKK